MLFPKALILVTIFPKIIENSNFLLNFHQTFLKFSNNVFFVQTRKKLMHDVNFFEKYAKIMHFKQFF